MLITHLAPAVAKIAHIRRSGHYRKYQTAWFDKWNYIIDRLGLFNPPGVDPFDHDPDDDIPFNGLEDL